MPRSGQSHQQDTRGLVPVYPAPSRKYSVISTRRRHHHDHHDHHDHPTPSNHATTYDADRCRVDRRHLHCPRWSTLANAARNHALMSNDAAHTESPVDPIEERLHDPAFEVRQSVVSELAGRVSSESRRIQQMLLRDRDRAVIEAMADALIAMADVESLSLVCEALYNNDDDEGVWQTLAWSIKEAVDGGRSVVTQGLRKVVEIDSVPAREGALDVLDWLGLLTEEEVSMHPPFRGGYTILKAGQSQEIRLIHASKIAIADFGQPPYLVVRPSSLTTPECGIVYLVDTGVPGLERLADQDPNDEWTLAAASVTWDGNRNEMVSRNHVYRIAGRAEVESREVDWAFRCEWRVQRQRRRRPVPRNLRNRHHA